MVEVAEDEGDEIRAPRPDSLDGEERHGEAGLMAASARSGEASNDGESTAMAPAPQWSVRGVGVGVDPEFSGRNGEGRERGAGRASRAWL